VDRIVLNAYFPLGHNPGGFRTWWRRFHDGSDEQLDNAHLMRLAGRFARRLKAWSSANGVPVIYCKAGERKHLIAEEYLASHEVGTGVFLVLAAKAVLAENLIRAAQAACRYSWSSPPSRSRRRMSRLAIWAVATSGTGSGRSGRALAMP
jgi:hypothetical protein